jgi:hypothetical protein
MKEVKLTTYLAQTGPSKFTDGGEQVRKGHTLLVHAASSDG